MQLKPAQIADHLQRGLAPIYVVAGDEPLLIREALDAIRARARRDGYAERDVLEADRGFQWQRLADTCASMSLFSARRIVELNLPTGAPGDEGAKLLQALAKAPPPDTLILVICGKLEGRSRSTAWYKAIEQAGASVYAWPVSTDELPRWIQQRLQAAGLSADADAVRLLADRTEGNLLAAAQDVEKLKLLVPSGRVTAEDVRAAVADSARFDPFDLSDKVLAGDAAGAARSTQRLREEGVEIPEAVGALAYTFRQLARAAGHFATSRNATAAMESAGIWQARQPSFTRAVSKVRQAEVLSWIQKLAAIDLALKSGAGERAWEDLITCVVHACRPPASQPKQPE